MAKIVLDSVVSGYNLGKINENFQKIEDALNDEVLYRDNPPGETNTVKQDVDMDGNSIINVGDLQVGGTFTVDGINLDGVNSAFIWRGAWSNLTAYAISDAVSYDGSSYICITAHTGSTPPSVNWDLLASIGATGPTTVLSTGITDSTATGRALITAANATVARGVLSTPVRAISSVVPSASALDLTGLSPDSDDVTVTGTTTINSVLLAAGRVVRLTFTPGATPCIVNHSGNIDTTRSAGFLTMYEKDSLVIRADSSNIVKVLAITQNPRKGVWTPALDFDGGTTGITYSYRTGSWAADGATTHVTCSFLLTSKGSSTGLFRITGLPYVAAPNGYSGQVYNAAYVEQLALHKTNVLGIMATTGEIFATGVAAGALGTVNLYNTDIADTTYLAFSFSYFGNGHFQ